ncbi:MAG TPA: MFS transporter, partial [Spirochaetia bacterium]|nr:MFS transporter [Spirochaetia bacterium]
DMGWPIMGGIMGAVMMVSAFITIFTVKERQGQRIEGGPGILKSYFQVLKQKVFLQALFPWALHITGVTVIQAAVVYYFRYIYHNESAFQIALGILLVSALVFIPVWVQISKRIGKKLSYNIGMGIFAVVVIIFFAVGHRFGVGFAYIIMAIAGIGFATQYVMPYAIVPDVVENDYAENGTKREGIYYGLWTFTSKVGQAFAIALSGWVLSAFGYVPNVAQSATSILGIRLLIGPVPALLFIGGIVILSFYPINRKYYEGIVAKVNERNAGR